MIIVNIQNGLRLDYTLRLHDNSFANRTALENKQILRIILPFKAKKANTKETLIHTDIKRRSFRHNSNLHKQSTISPNSLS